MMAMRVLPADRKTARASALDLGGALTATAGLALLVYGLTGAGDRGLSHLSSWMPLLLAAAAFVIFVRHEGRTADPLLPIGLLRSRPVAGANLTARHHCVNNTCDVPSGLVRPGRVGPACRTGVAAVPRPELSRHCRLAGGPAAARSARRSAHSLGWLHWHCYRNHDLADAACRGPACGSTAVSFRTDGRRPGDCIGRLDSDRNRGCQPRLPRRCFRRPQLHRASW